MQRDEKIIKKEEFKVIYSSAKRYVCEKGELILTTKRLLINCVGSWSKAFPIEEIRLEAYKENLEVYDGYYGKLLFKLFIYKPKEWKDRYNKLVSEMLFELFRKNIDWEKKRSIELENLFDMPPREIKKLYQDTLQERLQFERKNVRFNLDVWDSLTKVKNRKLKAFIIGHSYVAWYEWTKRLLYKIYRAKFGKGPTNDKELMDFLDNYPSLKRSLDTSEWGIRANQIRNCVSHEKFYFDYKSSKLIFMAKKERRVRLRDLRVKMYSMSVFYSTLLEFLIQFYQKN